MPLSLSFRNTVNKSSFLCIYRNKNSAKYVEKRCFLTPNLGSLHFACLQWPSILFVLSPFSFTNSLEWLTVLYPFNIHFLPQQECGTAGALVQNLFNIPSFPLRECGTAGTLTHQTHFFFPLLITTRPRDCGSKCSMSRNHGRVFWSCSASGEWDINSAYLSLRRVGTTWQSDSSIVFRWKKPVKFARALHISY